MYVLIAIVMSTEGELEGLVYQKTFDTQEACYSMLEARTPELGDQFVYGGCFEVPLPNV